MGIEEANQANLHEWLRMALALWPENSESQLRQELSDSLASDREKTFLFKNEDGRYVGFVTASLRTDYVEGASTSPVGYLEGIYVDETHRNRGIGRKLVEAAENWARERGCTEMGSDTWVTNTGSIQFHDRLGYQQEEILVHFLKALH